MNSIKFLSLVMCFGILTAVLSGCTGSSEKSQSGLDSSNWKLVRLNGVPVNPSSSKEITLLLDSDKSKASGKAPCNSYSGSYNEARGQIQFMNIISTKMACDDLQLESEYFAALNTITNYNIDPGKLKLLSGPNVVAEFSKIK